MSGSQVRVLHVMHLLLGGGVERRRLSLFRHLPAGYGHLVLCSEVRNHRFADQMRAVGVEVLEFGAANSRFGLGRYRFACSVVREYRPDLVHGAVFEGWTVGTIAGRLARVPVIIMEETSDPKNRRWKGHLLARAMAGLADHCVGVSEEVGRYLTDRLHVPQRKVTVIPNGVERPSVGRGDDPLSLRSSLGLEGRDLVVGSVGRLDDAHKRFSDLIKALARLKDLPVKLLLVGDGPDRRMLEELVEELGLEPRVLFAGWQEDLGDYYALMDVFALASEREAFGLVNAEAMRCGLPVVATRVGGIPEIVLDGDTGLLVAPRDVDGLANSIRRLLSDESLRIRMGAAGKLRADREFAAEVYSARVHDLYQFLLYRAR